MKLWPFLANGKENGTQIIFLIPATWDNLLNLGTVWPHWTMPSSSKLTLINILDIFQVLKKER